MDRLDSVPETPEATELTVLVVGSGGREHALVRALAADAAVSAVHAAPGQSGHGRLCDEPPDRSVGRCGGGRTRAHTGRGSGGHRPRGAAGRRSGGRRPQSRDRLLRTLRGRRSDRGQQGLRQGRDDGRRGAHRRRPGVLDARRRGRRAGRVRAAVRGQGRRPGLRQGRRGHRRPRSRPDPRRTLQAGGDRGVPGRTRGQPVRDHRRITVLPLQPAQDFKRVRDHDEGPNTGGMGAYTPACLGAG